MNPRVSLVAALLSCCSGDSSARGPPETVLALAGGDVTLPCSFSTKASEEFPTVEWSKEGLRPNVVFLYRDGCETPEMKNPAFQYRTSLTTKELGNGNVSLRISNVQLSDAGRYRCMRLWRTGPRGVTAVELVVGAVSEPKLSVAWAGVGGVTLLCAADCWLPQPDVYFLDEQGNDIGGDEPKRDQDARGCYSVRRRATLRDRDAAERVTCRVQQADINQTRDVEILLPVVAKKSCILTCGVAVGTVLLLVAACGSAVCLWKRFGKSAGDPSSPPSRSVVHRSAASGSSEDLSLLPSVRVAGAENARNGAIERLTAEVQDLKLQLAEKEDAVFRLRVDLASARSGSLTPGCMPQRRRRGFSRQSSHPARGGGGAPPPADADGSNRRHSTPARLLDVAPPSSGSRLGRSTSDPRGAAGSGPGAGLQRPRASASSSSPSATSSNRVALLGNVTEDSEMLIA